MKTAMLVIFSTLVLPVLGSSGSSEHDESPTAQRGTGPAINWYTIDGGGAMMLTGGTIALSGTLGQPDAGAVMTGGTLALTGGFWSGVAAAPPLICGCGDLDGNDVVDLIDFTSFASCFGLTAPDSSCTADVFACADLNGSGAIDLTDFSLFSTAFGLPPSGSPPDCQ